MTALADYPHLRYVDFANNLIPSLAPLETLQHLLSINLEGNQLEGALTVPNLGFLQVLNVARNKISEIKDLALPMLKKLVAKGAHTHCENGLTCV